MRLSWRLRLGRAWHNRNDQYRVDAVGGGSDCLRAGSADDLRDAVRGRGRTQRRYFGDHQKDGYEPQIVPLSKDIQTAGAAGFAGNILLGGIIGMGVDAATGAATDHKPNPVIVTLQPRMAVPGPRSARPRRSAPPVRPEAGT